MGWTCQYCTSMNPKAYLACDACAAPPPQQPVYSMFQVEVKRPPKVTAPPMRALEATNAKARTGHQEPPPAAPPARKNYPVFNPPRPRGG